MMDIKEALEKKSNLAILLKVKEYKSTFISVLKTRSKIQISLHKLFLDAPLDVKEAVVVYCLRRDKIAHSILKNYANRYFVSADYTHRLNVKKLKIKGEFFDLIAIGPKWIEGCYCIPDAALKKALERLTKIYKHILIQSIL